MSNSEITYASVGWSDFRLLPGGQLNPFSEFLNNGVFVFVVKASRHNDQVDALVAFNWRDQDEIERGDIIRFVEDYGEGSMCKDKPLNFSFFKANRPFETVQDGYYLIDPPSGDIHCSLYYFISVDCARALVQQGFLPAFPDKFEDIICSGQRLKSGALDMDEPGGMQ